jgi:uncharacterized protein (TIGR02271 family)
MSSFFDKLTGKTHQQGSQEGIIGNNPGSISSPYNVEAHTGQTANTNLHSANQTSTTSGTAVGGARHDDAMTRSEEQLKVGKSTVPAGSVSLNKYITTEHVQETVPVMKEHVIVEREPVTDANIGKALQGPDIKENQFTVPVFEERVEAIKETVPIERIRLRKVEETRDQQVNADLRKEHIDLIDNTAGKGVVLEPSTKGQQSSTLNNQNSTISGH